MTDSSSSSSYTVVINSSLKPSTESTSRHPYKQFSGARVPIENNKNESETTGNMNPFMMRFQPAAAVAKGPSYKLEAGEWQDRYRLHGLIQVVHEAFSHHYTLILKPTDIWQLISDCLSKQVSSNPEKYRSFLVSHEGKEEIEVIRDGFVLGDPNNDWSSVFSEFSAKIQKQSASKSKLPALISKPFTCSTPLTTLVSNLTIMECMQGYFKYVLRTRCGIPQVRLEGSEQDWLDIVERVGELDFKALDLDFWRIPLTFVVQQLAQSRLGKPDLQFWKSFYKYYETSGGDSVSGFVLLLFPDKINACLKGNSNLKSTSQLNEIGNCQFPLGVVSAPFVWKYLDRKLQMLLFAGFGDCHIANDEVSTTMGWKVVHALK